MRARDSIDPDTTYSSLLPSLRFHWQGVSPTALIGNRPRHPLVGGAANVPIGRCTERLRAVSAIRVGLLRHATG